MKLKRIPIELPLLTDNRCGECTVCCRILRIAELDKPGMIPCQHLNENGCGIYADRPASCRGFECLWLASMSGKPELRPDRSGLYSGRCAFGHYQ